MSRSRSCNAPPLRRSLFDFQHCLFELRNIRSRSTATTNNNINHKQQTSNCRSNYASGLAIQVALCCGSKDVATNHSAAQSLEP